MLIMSLSPTYHLSVQRLGKPKMSIVYCSAPINNNTYATLYPWTTLRLTYT